MSPVLTDAQRICKCTPKNCVEPTTRRETDPLRLPVCSTIPLNSTYHSLNSRRRQDFQAFFLRSETVCPHEPERFSSISGSIRTADICANIEKRPKNALSRLCQPTSQPAAHISTHCVSEESFWRFTAVFYPSLTLRVMKTLPFKMRLRLLRQAAQNLGPFPDHLVARGK